VRRDNNEEEIPASMLVPGDVVLLGEGDRLSADARLIEGSLEVDMAALTGESQPVVRSSAAVRRTPAVLESEDVVFAGTLCTAGEAEAVVFATAMSTQLGRIAALSQRVKPEISPLQRQVNRVAWLIAAIAVAAGVLFFFAGTTLAGLSLTAAVTFAIGLLVANVPEGLLPTITLSLAGGVRRMAARRALVKRLTAVETLGSTDVICTDKTGTLTEGSMSVRLLWVAGTELEITPGLTSAPPLFWGLLRTALRCNNAHLEPDGVRWRRSGDPTESALLVAAAQLDCDVPGAQRERDARRKRVFHFDPHLKRMTTLDQEPGGELWYHAKGAPLELVERCTAIRMPDGDRPITDAGRAGVRETFERYANRGLRVLGFAQRQVAQVEDGAPRPREAGIISRAMLSRAWLRLGALEAVLVVGGYFLVLLTAGWSPGDPTGAGTPLHHAYLQATTMTWAGIVACQMGAAFAVRTSRASLRDVGVFSNPYLLRGVAFALLFAAAIVYLPPLQAIFHTAALGPRELIVLAWFPVIVWGSDELWRWHARGLTPAPERHPQPAPAGAP